MLVDKSGMLHATVREKTTSTYALFFNHFERSTHKRKLSEEGVSWIETDDVAEAFKFAGLKD